RAEAEDVTQEALMPAGAARNALDCALWDAEAKLTGQSVAELCGIGFVAPVATCVTLSLADPAPMAAEAKTMSFQSLKLKLGSDGADTDIARLNAVRAARPDARLIVDANEAWSADDLPALLSAANTNGVSLIEQPLPAGDDAMLANIARPVPVCADEALHTVDDLADLRPRYDAINIKLDKTGGLTHALELAAAARAAGFRIMIGSMVSSSLAMAPAVLLAQDAEWVDLDSPALLAEDREPALTITDGEIAKPASALWG
ncbi:MAG: enolase C-terminal domain-like protein, partial [Pseudomonadota bacterium]